MIDGPYIFETDALVHYICAPTVYAANVAVLAPYRDADQTHLEVVYAGPSPTVALTFPDQATADAVKLQIV
jgi:hypothetical protein